MQGTDRHWFAEHLTGEILPRWLESAVTERGAFLPRLDREWRRRDDQVATLVSQSRLLYNFAQGWRLAGETAYRDAVISGARFLREAFRDPDHGGWLWSCTPEGRVLDERKDTYGHAFVLFGLAHAYRVTGDTETRDALSHTWETLDTRLRDDCGGFYLRTARDFTRPAETRSQNPVMHLFEALLAAGDQRPETRDQRPATAENKDEHHLTTPPPHHQFASDANLATWPEAVSFRAEAARVAEFIRSLVLPGLGLLPETYTADWQPLPAGQGGRIDLGHAFEWAYLLSAGVERGLDPSYLEMASRFLEGGLRLGLDADGGIRGSATLEGEPRVEGKGWWQQCEAIRALLHFAALRGRDDLREPAARVLDFVRARFIDPQFGGWYAQLDPDGTPARYDKGSEWKVDYHTVGMCVEALRLSALE